MKLSNILEGHLQSSNSMAHRRLLVLLRHMHVALSRPIEQIYLNFIQFAIKFYGLDHFS